MAPKKKEHNNDLRNLVIQHYQNGDLASQSSYKSYNSYIFGISSIMSCFSLNFPIFLYFSKKGAFLLEKSYFPGNDDVKLSSRI